MNNKESSQQNSNGAPVQQAEKQYNNNENNEGSQYSKPEYPTQYKPEPTKKPYVQEYKYVAKNFRYGLLRNKCVFKQISLCQL